MKQQKLNKQNLIVIAKKLSSAVQPTLRNIEDKTNQSSKIIFSHKNMHFYFISLAKMTRN